MADLIKGVIKYRVGDQWVGIRTLMGPTGPSGQGTHITGSINLGASQNSINKSIADALAQLGVTVYE